MCVLGVGGLSQAAARPSRWDRSPARSLAALRSWSSAVAKDRIGILDVASFPFAELLAHYQFVGRAQVCDDLTGELRGVHSRLSSVTAAVTQLAWPLGEWLPSTIDQHDGSYDTYIAAALLESLSVPGHEQGKAADDLIRALAADLTLTEAHALGDGRTCGPQRQRARASLSLLAKLTGPTAESALPHPVLSKNQDDRLVALAGQWAASVAELAPQIRMVTELTMLPVTPLHDERMFIRSLQIFETLYRQIGDALQCARDALQRLDLGWARTHLTEATRALQLSPALYRVMTTMPPDIFAIIRRYTTGRSAIQSRAYRRVEMLCAPWEPHPAPDRCPVVTPHGPTIQDALRTATAQLGPAAVAGVAAAMAKLDFHWRAMPLPGSLRCAQAGVQGGGEFGDRPGFE